MLVKVLPVLLFVPFKSHGSPRLGENTVLERGCQYICMYILIYAGRGQKVVIDTMDPKAGKSATYRYGGEGGIRTHGTVSRTLAFEASAFNRSATSPRSFDVLF